MLGRARALEVALSSDDYPGELAERYGWVNRTVPDGELDALVDTLARRVASFDKESIAAVKQQINRYTLPSAEDLKSSYDIYFTPSAGRGPSAGFPPRSPQDATSRATTKCAWATTSDASRKETHSEALKPAGKQAGLGVVTDARSVSPIRSSQCRWPTTEPTTGALAAFGASRTV